MGLCLKIDPSGVFPFGLSFKPTQQGSPKKLGTPIWRHEARPADKLASPRACGACRKWSNSARPGLDGGELCHSGLKLGVPSCQSSFAGLARPVIAAPCARKVNVPITLRANCSMQPRLQTAPGVQPVSA
ncbi:unnamed protein product [Effrenium voratum]|nr:unnamed protein product [Effrenium voratum]